MERVVLHTTSTCGYCFAAVRLLRFKHVPFDQVDVTGDRDARARLAAETGRRTVPQIFIDGVSIGGFEELLALERSGRLDALLSAPPEP